MVKFNFQGQLWNPQDEQISKLSLDGATFEGDIEVFQCCIMMLIIVKSCAVFDTIEIYRNKHMNEDIECEFLVMYKDERNRQTT